MKTTGQHHAATAVGWKGVRVESVIFHVFGPKICRGEISDPHPGILPWKKSDPHTLMAEHLDRGVGSFRISGVAPCDVRALGERARRSAR
jgi:hypothetical protein